MTPDQFTMYAAGIPYNPRTQNARGLLAPLVRSMGHVLFLLGIAASETDRSDTAVPLMTAEEKQNELDHAYDHIPPLGEISDSPVLSTDAKANILTYGTIILNLKTEWASWDHDDQIRTLRATANAAAALAASFDRELAGFRSDQSDPGTSL
jgi:hypothetical protein